MKKIAIFIIGIVIIFISLSFYLLQIASKIKGYTAFCKDDKGNVYTVSGSKIWIFDSKGSHLSELEIKGHNFCSIAVDSHGNIYTADLISHKIKKFSSHGNLLFSFGEFKSWAHIKIYKENLFLVDTTVHRIQILNFHGERLIVYGNKGEGKGEFLYPNDITWDSKGNFYVADTKNKRIQVFDSQFKYIREFHINYKSTFPKPTKIEVDNGDIYLITMDNNLEDGTIIKVNSEGKLLKKFESLYIKSSPTDITLEKEGKILTADGQRSGLELFDSSGIYLGKWGNKTIQEKWIGMDKKKKFLMFGRTILIGLLIFLVFPVGLKLYFKEREEKYKKAGVKIDEERLPKLLKWHKVILTILVVVLLLTAVVPFIVIIYFPEIIIKWISVKSLVNLILLSVLSAFGFLISLWILLRRKIERFTQGEKLLFFKEQVKSKLNSILKSDEEVLCFNIFGAGIYILTNKRILILYREILRRRITEEIGKIDYNDISEIKLKRESGGKYIVLSSTNREKVKIGFLLKRDAENFYKILDRKINVKRSTWIN